METLKKIVKNEYFPAATVLLAVVLFWTIAMFGGLSLLNNNQPPMATLTWMLFVYAAAVLTPLAGVLAAINIVRRWQRNRQYAQAVAEAEAEAELPDEVALAEEPETAAALESEPADEPAAALESEPAAVKPEQGRPAQHGNPAPKQPAMNHQAPSQAAAKNHQAKSQPLKKPAQTKQRKKAA